MDEYGIFLGADGSSDERTESEAALETRGIALVLSGAIPPYIDIAETASACRLVLANPASLLPQKALMSG